jgi:hypothetical protein
VAGDGGADSMLQFLLGDRMKRCQKIKRRQRARLGLMGRNRDTVQRHGDVGRRRWGTGEGKGKRQYQLGWYKSYYAEK